MKCEFFFMGRIKIAIFAAVDYGEKIRIRDIYLYYLSL